MELMPIIQSAKANQNSAAERVAGGERTSGILLGNTERSDK